jgi:uncharacterized oxidoreductase
MDLSSSTILVTGGGSGIGLALAARFLESGSRVVACGRREEKLRQAQSLHPRLEIRVADVETASGRRELLEWTDRELPDMNVLVNNAGIQRRMDLTRSETAGDWESAHGELAINLEAPIHLSMLCLESLRAKPRAAIINVTSGLAFAPLAGVPVYCATKAAIHSFTLTLRRQLAGSSVEVIEIIPPAVDTDLGGPGLHTFGVALDEFADAAFEGLRRGENEIAYGFAAQSSRASRAELEQMFEKMNARTG